MNRGSNLVEITTVHRCDSWTIDHEVLRYNSDNNDWNDDNVVEVDNSNNAAQDLFD